MKALSALVKVFLQPQTLKNNLKDPVRTTVPVTSNKVPQDSREGDFKADGLVEDPDSAHAKSPRVGWTPVNLADGILPSAKH